MTKMLKSIIAGAAVLIGACFIGQTQQVQAADDYALRLAEDNQWYYYQDDEVDTAYQAATITSSLPTETFQFALCHAPASFCAFESIFCRKIIITRPINKVKKTF